MADKPRESEAYNGNDKVGKAPYDQHIFLHNRLCQSQKTSYQQLIFLLKSTLVVYLEVRVIQTLCIVTNNQKYVSDTLILCPHS